jgi:hypothetical protein
MTTQTTGTVMNGQLQLDSPLPLPDRSRVNVTVEVSKAQESWRQRMQQGLQALEKLKAERPIGSGGVRFTREQLHERH